MSFATDLRYALRRLIQSPGFSLASTLMLAIGVTISATMFAVLSGVLSSLPYPQSEQLVMVESVKDVEGPGALTPLEADRLADGPSPFADFGYYSWGGMTLYSEQRPRELRMASVSAGFFSTLAAAPVLGRWFNADDFADGSDSVIISHAEWQRAYGGRADVIGQTLDGSAGKLTVVGVMPSSFSVPSTTVQVWRPLSAQAYPLEQAWTHSARFIYGLARLDPALSPAQLDQRLQAIGTELVSRYQLTDQRTRLATRDALSVLVGDLRSILWAAFAVALLVLLIACANVAILIDARQIARRQQLAVLQALGASRSRVYAALLLEVGLISVAAVGAGALLATLSVDSVRRLAADSLPRSDAIAVDLGVWLFLLGLALLAPLIAAAAGSLRLRGRAVEAIGSGGRSVLGRARRRQWLPTLGVALSTISLTAGGALLYSFVQLQQVDPGFAHEQIYAMQLFHNDEPERQRQFADTLGERLQAIPGVQAVAWTSAAPLSIIGSSTVELRPANASLAEPLQLGLRRVSADYQSLLNIPLLAGRAINAGDRAGGEPVVVINQSLAQRLYGNESALNQMINLPLGPEQIVPHRVVGVSADLRNRGLGLPPGPEALIPFAAQPVMGMTFLVRGAQPIAGVEDLFKDALYATDPREATTRIFRLTEEFEQELAPARFFAAVVGVFALAALALAAFGIYAVAALRQQQRSAEFGLRLAVGARPRTLLLTAMGDSVRSLLVGVAIGLFGAWAMLQLLQAQVHAAAQSYGWVMLAATLVLLTSAGIAALFPALRAARVDPVEALRSQ